MSLRSIPVILKTQCSCDGYISIISKHFHKELSKHKGEPGAKSPWLSGQLSDMECGLRLK